MTDVEIKPIAASRCERTTEVDACASSRYALTIAGSDAAVPIDYVTPQYRLSDAALAADVPLNTLRSYYQRGDFRVVGGEEKKGRGSASLLNLRDVMCIAVACKLIAVGIKPSAAFTVSTNFAYFRNSDRLPSEMFPTKRFTVLICYPPDASSSRIVGVDRSIPIEDVFSTTGRNGRLPPVIVLLNDVERRVFWALHLSGPEYEPVDVFGEGGGE